MAGLGIKNFTSEVLTSSDVDGYLMQQGIPVFASAAARDSAYTAASVTPADGMFCYTTDANTLWSYDGSTWNAALTSTPTSYVTETNANWTNLVPGNGTTVADIQAVSLKQLRYKGQITFGSTSSIGGAVTLTIPAGLTGSAQGVIGHALYNDTGTRLYQGSTSVTPSDTEIAFAHSESGDSGLLGATSPFTWTTGDVLQWDITIGYD